MNLYGLGRVRHGYAGFAETLIEYDLWSDARIRAADYDRKRAFGLLRPHGEFEATCWGATWVMWPAGGKTSVTLYKALQRIV